MFEGDQEKKTESEGRNVDYINACMEAVKRA